MRPSTYAETFILLLNEKFKNAGAHASCVFTVMPGRKYDRIVQSGRDGRLASSHAFVERETGRVYKCASWKAPAKDFRYFTVEEAAEAADLYCSYLYK